MFARYGYVTAGGSPEISAISKARLKTFYIYENDNLIRSYVPCYKKMDNTVGLYDIINDKFYTNSGTGEFTYKLSLPID